MPKLITVTDMIRSFSDIVGRVYYKGETFDIKKGSNIVARLSPSKEKTSVKVSELGKFLKNSPHLDQEDISNFENDIKEIRELKGSERFSKWD